MASPQWNFDIDTHLNRFIPRNRISRLPTPMAWFLGYRAEPQPKIGSVLVWWWAFVGAFLGLLVLEAVSRTAVFEAHGAPVIIASFGAAAILEYHTIESPLAQPRNTILGQLFSAVIGITISKLFHLMPESAFATYGWISGPLSVGLASAAMGVTNTVHPPAGATALLCCTDKLMVDLGWNVLWVEGLGCVLLVVVALVVNNLQRRWPVYWWTSAELGGEKRVDEEKRGNMEETVHFEWRIVVRGSEIEVPDWLILDRDEQKVVEALSARLRHRKRRDPGQAIVH
ncbi:HPP family-domain-containing protein [Calycina marina]|uniref:HPP family-domain-containing protein n=1 Tax=Calycina marina TaxID=1763456 RepID=A0A9P7Z077_9HELO|nr:HPP family-domain-containing protein [Calycina marina]